MSELSNIEPTNGDMSCMTYNTAAQFKINELIDRELGMWFKEVSTIEMEIFRNQQNLAIMKEFSADHVLELMGLKQLELIDLKELAIGFGRLGIKTTKTELKLFMMKYGVS